MLLLYCFRYLWRGNALRRNEFAHSQSPKLNIALWTHGTESVYIQSSGMAPRPFQRTAPLQKNSPGYSLILLSPSGCADGILVYVSFTARVASSTISLDILYPSKVRRYMPEEAKRRGLHASTKNVRAWSTESSCCTDANLLVITRYHHVPGNALRRSDGAKQFPQLRDRVAFHSSFIIPTQPSVLPSGKLAPANNTGNTARLHRCVFLLISIYHNCALQQVCLSLSIRPTAKQLQSQTRSSALLRLRSKQNATFCLIKFFWWQWHHWFISLHARPDHYVHCTYHCLQVGCTISSKRTFWFF